MAESGWTTNAAAPDMNVIANASSDTTSENVVANDELQLKPEETVAELQKQIADLQKSHSDQVQNMMTTMGAVARNNVSPNQQEAQNVAPENHFIVPEIENMDDDDPYAGPLKVLNKKMGAQQAQTHQALAYISQQLNSMGMQQTRSTLEGKVSAALGEHRVPSELEDMVRTTVYAYMANTNEPAEPAALVGDFMQSLGAYNESMKKGWAENLHKPRPMTALGSAPGVPNKRPSTWDEAKQASLAMLRGMTPHGNA